MKPVLDNTDNWTQLRGAVPCNEDGKISGVLITYHDDGVPMVSIMARDASDAELLQPRAISILLMLRGIQ